MLEPMRKITVVQVLPALESGGVERGTLEVAKYLVEHGHRSLVISAGGRMVEQLTREGSEHVTWDLGAKSPLTLRHIPRLRRFLQDQAVDILHVRSRMPAWVCYLAWRGMDPRRRPRFITTVHGLYSVNAYSAIMARGERVIAVSETVREYLLKHYPALEPRRIIVIPRGVDPSVYRYGYRPPQQWLERWFAQYPELKGKKILTLPGRITRLKGHEDFIDLIGRLVAMGEPVHGLIVGGAVDSKQTYLSEVKNKVVKAGLHDRITFTGHRADLREIIAISDVVLSLSSKPESYGRTVLEALSMGVPVIGYDHGGVGEQLGQMFPEGRVPVGAMDSLVRRYQDIQALGRIKPRASPPTLQQMLDSTLSAYMDLLS